MKGERRERGESVADGMTDGAVSGGPGFGTVALHGEGGEANADTPRPHVPALYQTSTFPFSDMAAARRAFEQKGKDAYIYSRVGNPTVRALERRIAALETHGRVTAGETAPADGPVGGEAPEAEMDCRFFASGMAAISAVALGVAADGGRIVCQDGIYGSTLRRMRELDRYGITVDFVPAGDAAALRDAAESGPPPALVWVETPANPLLQTTEMRAAAGAAHDAGALLAVDATFATPAVLRPLAWDADLSVHSTTKFISGHGVALGGAVTGRRRLIEEVVEPARTYFGGSADPFAAWLTLMGLATLEVRMRRHASNAAALAAFLAEHEAVERVHYPDPAELPDGQMATGGAMLSFELAGGEPAAIRAVDRLRLCTLAATLGTPDTLIQHPWSMSHAVMPEERRRATGIDPGLLRVSVGLESEADILGDFARALDDGSP